MKMTTARRNGGNKYEEEISNDQKDEDCLYAWSVQR